MSTDTKIDTEDKQETPAVEPGGPRCFRIRRYYRPNSRGDMRPARTIKSNVTEYEAQEHCLREDTRGPGWFDGYDYMQGCRP